MKFCQKLGSRSPPVITVHQWKAFKDTIKPSVFQDNQTLIYLSATEGNDINGLKNFDHWPKSTVARTGVLRDYYTGQELENYGRLWNQRTALGKHCVSLSKGNPSQWNATSCQGMQGNAWCPCQEAPLLLRGLCFYSLLRVKVSDRKGGIYYTPRNSANGRDFKFLSHFKQNQIFSNIKYKRGKWILSRSSIETKAFCVKRKQNSYPLGRQTWTISKDEEECHLENGKNPDQDIRTELKLTGCNQGSHNSDGDDVSADVRNVTDYGDYEFTCDDGQCVSMEKRCDHYQDCEDGSDEERCNLISLQKGYKKDVPPFTRISASNDTILPVPIIISMNLIKIMNINEDANTIDLQFQISLEWKDHRITFNNLKRKTFLNVLAEKEKKEIWVPIVIFANTNNKWSTRVGNSFEYSTTIVASREGSFTR